MDWVKNNKLLLTFLTLFLSAMLFSKLEDTLKYQKFNLAAFSNQLQSKERICDAYSDSILQAQENHSLVLWIKQNSIELTKLYESKGILFSVYHKDSLVFWSNNAIPLPKRIKDLQSGYFFAGNAHTEIRKTVREDLCVLALIVIKFDYPYENQYLHNSFHPSFNFPCDAALWKSVPGATGSIFSKENNYLFSIKTLNACNYNYLTNLVVVLYLFSLVFLALYIRTLFGASKNKNLLFLVIAIVLFAIRFAFQFLGFPSFLFELKLFNPQIFYLSHLFPSIGDTFITVALLTYLIFVAYKELELKRLTKNPVLNLSSWFVLVNLALTGVFYLLRNLIRKASFNLEAYDVLSLSQGSLVGYLIIALLLFAFILIVDKSAQSMKGHFSFRKLSLFWLVSQSVFMLMWFLIKREYDLIFSWAFLVLALWFWLYIRFKKQPQFTSLIALIAIFSAFATVFIRSNSFYKRSHEARIFAQELSQERDFIAEGMLSETLKAIKADEELIRQLVSEDFNYEEFVQNVEKIYISGYLKKFSAQITLCTSSDSLFYESDPENVFPCFDYFNSMIEKSGDSTQTDNLWKINNDNGSFNYLLMAEVELEQPWLPVRLYMELRVKPNFEVLGYPELLLESPSLLQVVKQHYSHAKYVGGHLINKSGDFPYALHLEVYPDGEGDIFEYEGFYHVLYGNKDGSSQIVTFAKVKFYNLLIAFTYIFLFFFIQVLLFLTLSRKQSSLLTFELSIKNKISYTIIGVLFISLILVGVTTIFYTVRQFENNRSKNLEERLKSVTVELEHKLANYEKFGSGDVEYLTELLIKFSNVFFTDINLYSIQGELLATSRREIFDQKLTGTNMNAKAFYELTQKKKARFTQKEFIGQQDYYSAYVPFVNGERKLLAYLNLPYFSENDSLRQELMRLIVAIINIYAFLVIMAIFGSVWISNKLTEPLRVFQQRISNIALEKNNERIDYKGKDEIAALVNEYNKMLEELSKSAKLLAQSERETAWQEMARQIAHEIKNPLTPMKLSVQLLERAWMNQDEDFGERLQRISRTMIEQINSLSNIATEFGQFAKISSYKPERVNLIERVETSIALYHEHNETIFHINENNVEKIHVLADKERVLQVFNNIVKNAIQAIPKNKQGEIKVDFSNTNQQVIVCITDNGIGIPKQMEDKLFQPSFTTKTSGTGLGLAIVRTIMEDFGGSIWFESEEGKGTSFYLSFPKKDF